MSTLDLPAYFARIGYEGGLNPDLGTLHALHYHHVLGIPFENLDVLLGRPIALELPVIERKLVRDRRGGYCFEHNSLFAAVLRTLGYAVTPLLGRVRWQAPADHRGPLTHMILRVECEGRSWLVDVGFGGVGSTAPLALDTTGEQTTPHEPRRLLPRNGKLVHQLLGADGWADVYEFALEEPAPIDFELGNWFSCTHPKAHFRSKLVVTRAGAGCRFGLLNREFTTRHADGRVEKREIASPDDLLALLAERFDLHFPAGTRFGSGDVPWPA
jgi:N-hydroxyarylamine O-acetyltransferase